MTKYTVKQMLVDLYKDEREQARCALVHELKKEAEDFIVPYTNDKNVLLREIKTLNSQINELRTQVSKIEGKLAKDLSDLKLSRFDQKSCGDSLHKRLCDFDMATNDHIREILEGEKKEKKDE